ncbi:hypothetical protein SAMN05216390_11065 [Lachnospiraceae bacterium KH1T2]|nr:hypothetical protein SAMN05216390_11065 [Lachnospiraceae bacterium KH1T2]
MEKKERYYKLLEKLEEEFNKAEYKTRLIKEGEGGVPFSILRVGIHDFATIPDGVLAEFFFLDTEESAEHVMYFYSVITIEDEMDRKYSDELAKSIARLNFYIQGGCFAINAAESTLVYRNTGYYFDSLSDEQIFDGMSLNAIHAVQIAEPYGGILSGVAKGENTFEEIMELLPEQ